MKDIRRSDSFIDWMKKLKDTVGKALILKRISRLKKGNPGDVEPIGEGVSEMRVHYGPGYRVYFKDTGQEIILLLCGGDKSSQKNDMAKARELSKMSLSEFKGEE